MTAPALPQSIGTEVRLGPERWEVRLVAEGPARMDGCRITAFDRCHITVLGNCEVTAYDECEITIGAVEPVTAARP